MIQLIPPTTVAVLRAMEIIISYFIQARKTCIILHIIHNPRQAQALVMAEVPNSLALGGSSLVVLSVLAFALEQPILSSLS